MAGRKRKGLSPKARFEVFKRDGFKCQYCGGAAPQVVLHVDHIQPVSKGGENDLMNLITSCLACNGGKGARELGDDTVVAKQRAQIEELNERREQLEMMLRWRDGLSDITDASVKAIQDRYAKLVPGWHLNESSAGDAKKMLSKYPLSEILDALEKSATTYVHLNKEGRATQEAADKTWSLLPGVLRLSKEPDSVRQLYYIRGIMRKRYRYCPDWQAIKLLKAAVEAGASEQDLRDIVLHCTCWTQFEQALADEWGVEI